MTEPKIYLINCKMCKDKTQHKISSLNRKRGVKLKCRNCGYVRDRHFNLRNIQSKEYVKRE